MSDKVRGQGCAGSRVEGFNCFTEMCSGCEAGSYSRLVDFVYHPTLGSRVMKKKKVRRVEGRGLLRVQGYSSARVSTIVLLRASGLVLVTD